MPGGDKTGPLGKGSRTGRQQGLCTGNDTPGSNSNQPGSGMGLRRNSSGRGRRKSGGASTGIFGRRRNSNR